jgi:hypothetical protein
MSKPTNTIIETVAFTARMDRLSVSPAERGEIYDAYAVDPEYGKVIKNTGLPAVDHRQDQGRHAHRFAGESV